MWAFFVIVVGSLLIFFANHFSWNEIETFLDHAPLKCPLKSLIGLRCAFCGMTHSWIAAFRGEWALSFHENIFGLPVMAIAIVSVPVRGKVSALSHAKKQTLLWVLIGIALIYTAMRNL